MLEPKPNGERDSPEMHELCSADTVGLVAGHECRKVKTGTTCVTHRGHRRRRVHRDVRLNPGDPYASTKDGGNERVKPSDEHMEVGVDHSSDEASNDRRAKGRQSKLAKERNSARTQQRRKECMVNETRSHR